MKLTSLLRKAVIDDFGAYVFRRGFQPGEMSHGFCRFRRPGEERDDLIEVQFDKRNRPKFVLNFGVVPSSGVIDGYGRFMGASNVQIGHLVNHGRLYSVPYSIFWFKPHDLFGFRSEEQSVTRVIEHLIRLFEQVEFWFETGKSGANVQVYKDEWNAPGVRKKSMQERGVWPPDGWTEEDEQALRM